MRARVSALLAVGWLAVATPAQAAGAVRALIVGIDAYPYAGDANLKGAVNDARSVRDRLVEKPFGLALAAFPSSGECRAESDTSRILIDACATRAGILAAFDALAQAAQPGDTLLFYFAGHGSQTPIMGQERTKALDQTSTIVAADSRKPVPGGVVDDIAGTTLDKHIRAAQAAGLTVVTIFDSCNSGTATRGNLDGSLTRSIDPSPADIVHDDPDPPRLLAATLPGARIHLAAAADGTKAVERNGHGRFTTAMIEAISAAPNATYGDILRQVRARVAQRPTDQVPQGEGDLTTTSFLGLPGDRSARLFAAKAAKGGRVRIDGDGTLSGITEGSIYALYGSEADALADANRIALARVAEAQPQGALLEVDGKVRLPASPLTAREIAHSFGPLVLPVGFRGVAEADIAAVLKDLPLVRRDDAQPEVVVARENGQTLLLAATGSRIATIDKIAGASDVERIGIALRRVANASALLALPEKPHDARLASFAITTTGCRDCHVTAPVAADAPRLTRGDMVRMLLTSGSARPVYPYLFAISPNYAITRLYPPSGASDALAPSDDFYVGETVTAAAVGETRLVLIVSEVPIPAGPLEQGGLPRAGCDSRSALAMLLCAAANGTRAGDVLPQGDFDVIKTVVTIQREDAR